MKSYLVLAALTLTSAAPLHAAIVLTIAPQSQTVGAGSTTQVQVRIAGLGFDSPPSLGAFDFNLAFNPTLVSFTSLTFGDPILGDQLNLSGSGPIDDSGIQSAGLLEYYEISLDSPTVLDSMQAGSFVLATIKFQALAPGTTSLISSLNSISDSQGASLGLTLQSGSITVFSTPEPCTIAFIPFAAVWLALLTRRRRSTQASRPYLC